MASAKGKFHSEKQLKVQEEQGDSRKTKVRWIDVFPSGPGEGVLIYYSSKNRKITFVKMELGK